MEVFSLHFMYLLLSEMDFQVAHNLDKFPGVQKETFILKEANSKWSTAGVCRELSLTSLSIISRR